jgi:puromycin-sensitive aminopeptidase
MNPKAYRLPQTALPRAYEIALDVRLGVERFQGQVAIQLEIVEPCATIELNARGLEVAEATLALPDSRTLPCAVTLDAERELVLVTPPEPLTLGAATLTLTYTGRVSSGLEGLYLAVDGADRMICTQCEPVGARAILPCFDEPPFKARFAWRVTTAPDAVVLTNGALTGVAESSDGSAKTWTFAPTAPMSSYLLALVVGDLASTPERVVNGVPLRIWALRGKEQTGQFALDYTARLLPWYEDYFATPYHFGKLDQIAVPAFSAGAMENVGLILSQAILLLMDPRTASLRQQKSIAEVIAHEVAHMWFGNLVTMRWWDDIWLNEAFASWMAYRVVDALSPEYNIWDDFSVSAERILETDALANTHAIFKPADTPEGIMENFDQITYTKGCAVLRMLEHFLGQDTFRAGLRTYMREFAEGNATGGDLWRHLQSASREPVTEIMESWVLQPGHPIVRVELEREGGATRLRLSQRRFFSGAGAGADNTQLWGVPLVIRYRDDAGLHETHHLLSTREATLALDVSGMLVWCYANAGEVGFYRQQLDATLVRGLLAHLDELTPAERRGLLRDQWALVANGSQPIGAFLDVLDVLARDDDYRIVRQVVTTLETLEHYLQDAGDARALAGFRAWVRRTFAPKLAALGYEPRTDDTANQTQARPYVVSAMTRYAHDASAIEQARQWAAREAADPTAVDANLASVFVGAAAQFGDAALYDRYIQIYQQRKAAGAPPQVTERYVASFPRFQQPELVARTLELLNGDLFPFQSMLGIMAPMLFQPATQVATWEWLKSRWSYLEEVGREILPFIVQFTGQLPGSLRADLVAFFAERLHGEYQASQAQALEQIDQTEELKTRTRPGLLAWFQAQPADDPSADPAGDPPETPATPVPADPPASGGASGGPTGWLRRLFGGGA